MIALVLASWLLTQEWAWDVPARAVSYRVYWTERLDVWCAENMFVPTFTCDAVECRADWPEPSASTYYSIVSVAADGTESAWDRAVPKTECFP